MMAWFFTVFIAACLSAINLMCVMVLSQWLQWQWAVFLCWPVSLVPFVWVAKASVASKDD